MLRHGSATRNAKFPTDSELKLMYGWSMGSKMPADYVHLSGRDLDDKLTSLYGGKKVEQAKPEFAPVICPRCSETASPGMLYCPRCASPLGMEERSRMAAEDEYLFMGKEFPVVDVAQMIPDPFTDVEALVCAFAVTFPISTVGVIASYVPVLLREMVKESRSWEQLESALD